MPENTSKEEPTGTNWRKRRGFRTTTASEKSRLDKVKAPLASTLTTQDPDKNFMKNISTDGARKLATVKKGKVEQAFTLKI
jgi:hypothetical protein